ncbi:conserved exported hypothetical protein [Candidatus Accumulibacter aalborgensis]|uniref:MacB-like periplasmic core domain-containing protein n=1 Tax=Candidatus Accumulibacter aalborgensis TaxID=1860102 RepID=A0A1A8XZV1_9PROT|nr:conserved exported hypothetical protein [Candidatus Accumulibacter aalborgensis]
MRYLIALALRSAWNRRYTLSFTLLSIALATTLLVGVERLRHDVRESFSQSVSGTDLVVGARSSPVDALCGLPDRRSQPEYALDVGAKNLPSSSRGVDHPALAGRLPSWLSGPRHLP